MEISFESFLEHIIIHFTTEGESKGFSFWIIRKKGIVNYRFGYFDVSEQEEQKIISINAFEALNLLNTKQKKYLLSEINKTSFYPYLEKEINHLVIRSVEKSKIIASEIMKFLNEFFQ